MTVKFRVERNQGENRKVLISVCVLSRDPIIHPSRDSRPLQVLLPVHLNQSTDSVHLPRKSNCCEIKGTRDMDVLKGNGPADGEPPTRKGSAQYEDHSMGSN